MAAPSFPAKTYLQDSDRLVSEMKTALETMRTYMADGLVPAISATFASQSIVASGVYAVGDWRKQIHASYMDEDVPTGEYLGIYGSETSARNDGLGGDEDWYANSSDGFFYRLDGSSGQTRIYRAGSAEMPALIDVSATASRVIIYDLTKVEAGSPEMWMEFATGSGFQLGSTSTLSSVTFGGSRLYVGNDFELRVIDFADDEASRHNTGGVQIANLPIAGRNQSNTLGTAVAAGAIVNNVVNSVATYLDTAEGTLNDAGVQIPYVLVGTDGGLSQIDPDGTVYDLTSSDPDNDILHVAFNEAGPDILFAGQDTTTQTRIVMRHDGLLTADKTAASYEVVAGVTSLKHATAGSPEALPGISRGLSTAANVSGVAGTSADNEFFIGNGEQLVPYILNESAPLESLGAYIRAASTTGWMKGDVQAAWLGTIATGSVTGTISDLSGNGNDLTVTGTLTAAAVATGAELTALSGFSATDYAETAAGADGITTGDFCFSGWAYVGAAGSDNDTVFFRQDPASGAPFSGDIALYRDSTEAFLFTQGGTTITTSGTYADQWVFYVAQRASGTCELFINAVSQGTAADVVDFTNANAVIRYGLATNNTNDLDGGKIALARFSNTAMTAADISRVYRDELKLFQENAACTLNGGSDAVTGLAYDSKRNRVVATTSAGTSVFAGLNRVAEYSGTTAPGTHDGAIVAGVSGSAQVDKPAVSFREALAVLRG